MLFDMLSSMPRLLRLLLSWREGRNPKDVTTRKGVPRGDSFTQVPLFNGPVCSVLGANFFDGMVSEVSEAGASPSSHLFFRF